MSPLNTKRVLVVGGGVSGLVTSYYAHKNGRVVTLLESTNRWGGMIESHKSEYGLVETAANGILNSFTTEELFTDLGLELTHHQRASQRRYFWNGKKMTRLPVSIFSIVSAILGFFTRNSDIREDDNLWNWACRIFGKNVTESIIEPALGGIYGTPLQSMHPRMIFSTLDWEEGKTLFQRISHSRKQKPKLNSKPKIRGLVSFPKGMEEFPKALVRFLDGKIDMRLDVMKLSLGDLQDKYSNADIFVCLPLKQVRDLVQKESWMEEIVKKQNVHILNYHSIATTTRFSRDSIFRRPGFGVLFPKELGILAKGVLSNDSIFPGRIHKSGVFSETWIHAGDFLKDSTEQDVQKHVEEDRAVLLKIGTNSSENKTQDSSVANKPFAMFTKIWKDAFPVYDLNLYRWNLALDRIEEESIRRGQKIEFLGNYRKGIGLRSLIENAKAKFPNSLFSTVGN